MAVAVLGGGLQGCCAALALAERGLDVVLFDRNRALLSRTAVANEGKIHLGYMYAADPTLATARTMMQGALAFAPFMHRYVPVSDQAFTTSAPARYVVHRDSQHDGETVAAYLAAVHDLVGEAARGRERAYFGLNLLAPLRRWSAAERGAAFDPAAAILVFDTPEVAINPIRLAAALAASIRAHPRIALRLSQHVLRVGNEGDGVDVVSEGADGAGSVERFDHAVNALWEGRLTIDAAIGLRPHRPWLHRLKYGVSFTLPAGWDAPPSATFVSGPFGEAVSYPDRQIYLTWYPECLHGISAELAPPDWPQQPPEPLRSRILAGTLAAMARIMPGLAGLDPAALPDAVVRGGVIVAWGKSDIYDPQSELHRRYEIGVTSAGRYHSIDPGKLTMAPYFAEICAGRIAGCA